MCVFKGYVFQMFCPMWPIWKILKLQWSCVRSGAVAVAFPICPCWFSPSHGRWISVGWMHRWAKIAPRINQSLGPNPVQESIAAQVITEILRQVWLFTKLHLHSSKIMIKSIPPFNSIFLTFPMVFPWFSMAFPWLSAFFHHVTCSFTSTGAVSASVTELPPSR